MARTSPSVWLLLARIYLKADKPYNLINSNIDLARKHVLEYVREQMIKHGELRPPFLKEPEKSKFIKSRKIVEIQYSNLEGRDGYLIVTNYGFKMLINNKLGRRRKRTVIAHELGHTFLYNINVTPPKPYYKSTPLEANWRNIEGPSFEIGREILAPEPWIKNYTRGLKPSIKLFNKLITIFDTTKTVMARRLVHDLKIWDVFIFFPKYDPQKRQILKPGVNERFKGKKTFKKFNIDKHWTRIKNFIEKSMKTGEIIESPLRIVNKIFYIETDCSLLDKKGTGICIITVSYTHLTLPTN